MNRQEEYDEAMFDFSKGDLDAAIAQLRRILEVDPSHFDAQLAIGMAYSRKGEHEKAIAEGKRAEQLRPKDQLVHTNLSLFYMKAGDRVAAEHHGLQARIAGWREDPEAKLTKDGDPDLRLGPTPPPATPPPEAFPDMPWKKKSGSDDKSAK